jgi:1-acyl-sn-glycerol-3-phosphate acyltransferase
MKLQVAWIIVRSLSCTLRRSLAVLRRSFFGRRSTRSADINRIIQKWADRLLQIVHVNYDIENPYHVSLKPNQRYIIMSNHASHYDIPLILKLFPKHIVRMIAKKELLRVPIWGHAMRVADFISIDREHGRQALKDLEVAKAKMLKGIAIWVAPEGTRTRSGRMNLFKKGGFAIAQQTGATIIPVGIRGSYDVLPPETLQFGLNKKVKLYIGQPIDASSYNTFQRLDLMKKVETTIRDLVQEQK